MQQHNKVPKKKHNLFHKLPIAYNLMPIIDVLNASYEQWILMDNAMQLATSVSLGMKEMVTAHNVIKDTFCLKVNALLDNYHSQQLLNQ
jgi:hypothetical protein